MNYNINLILAVDNNFAIGNEDELLYFFPKDLQRFVQKTKEKTVVMGRVTWESLPKKLPKRKNLVITNQSELETIKRGGQIDSPDLTVNDLDIILKLSLVEEVWIIGGASIYQEFLPYAKTIELTKINTTVPVYDTDVKWLEQHLLSFNVTDIVAIQDVNKMDGKASSLEFITYERR